MDPFPDAPCEFDVGGKILLRFREQFWTKMRIQISY